MARRGRVSTSLQNRADQAGIVVATANLPLTFQQTLMPRSTVDQGLITGLSFATNHATVTLIQDTVQAATLALLGEGGGDSIDEERWSRLTIAADAGAFAAGLALQRLLEIDPDERLPRAGARTAAWWLSVTGASGALVGLAQELLGRVGGSKRTIIPAFVPVAGALAGLGEYGRRRRARLDVDLPRTDEDVSSAKSLALGVGIAVGTSALTGVERKFADSLARTLSERVGGNEALWRPVAHAVAIAVIGGGVRKFVEKAFGAIEKREESVETAFDIPPLTPMCSGSLDSLVPFSTLSKQGRRYVWTLTHPRAIDEVMGETGALTPIRAYVGLESAPTPEERVALAMRELERTGAFERAWILVDAPTGTGYVNYAAVAALELLARGDSACVALQYSARPSPLSLDRVDQGSVQNRLLLEALRERLQRIPVAARPKLVLFGESLGAWSSQDPFIDRGTQGLVDLGVDYAIWIGTPHFSRWKEQVLRDRRPDVVPELLGVFNDIGEWRALDDAGRRRLRYVMVTHHNDGVALFGPDLAIRAPKWLTRRGTRPATVPRGMRWVPTTTFFQVLVDMKNAATVVPGVFEAKGHDYRADLLPFFHAVLGLPATDAQLDRITGYLEHSEVTRSNWVAQHGAAERSMAAALLTDWMTEHPDELETVLLPRLQRLARESHGAEGAAG